MEKSQKNNKIKISVLTWNNKFELPEESYSVSNSQNYFDYIIKKHKTMTENPPKIYIDKTENTIPFEIKTGYYLERLKLR